MFSCTNMLARIKRYKTDRLLMIVLNANVEKARLIKQWKKYELFCPLLRKALLFFIRVLEIVLWRSIVVVYLSNSSLNFKIIYNKFVPLFKDSSYISLCYK